VLLDRIALVVGEAVSRVKRVKRAHHGVALDLREDGRRGDAGGLGVAFYDRLLRDVDFLQSLGVDQQVLRR
jgi:hypothetical protein